MTETTTPTKDPSPKSMAAKYTFIHHHRHHLFIGFLALLLLVGITLLTLWLVYRPNNPQFTLLGAAVYDMNTTTSPSLISTTMQFTLLAHNPNKRVSIFYDQLSAYVSYRGMAITPPLQMPPLYQGHQSSVSMSPVLGGEAVPVGPDAAAGLVMQQAYGVVELRLVLMGKMRWKGGAFKSGKHDIYVRCDMLVGMKKGVVGQLPLLGSPDCNVDLSV